MSEDKPDGDLSKTIGYKDYAKAARAIEAQRGSRFLLFPPGTPILFLDYTTKKVTETPTQDLLGPGIHINGIPGEFRPFFSGGLSLGNVEELNTEIEEGHRTILATRDGPVEMVQGGSTTASANRMGKGKFTELAQWKIPDGITADSGIYITLFMPRLAIHWTPKSYNQDKDQKYYYGPTDENGEEYYTVIMPTDPAFLRRIEVEIS